MTTMQVITHKVPIRNDTLYVFASFICFPVNPGIQEQRRKQVTRKKVDDM